MSVSYQIHVLEYSLLQSITEGPSVSERCSHIRRPPSDSEDELDKLTRSFEEQASQALQQTSQKELAARPRKPRGMKEIREEGLQAPVSEQSKYTLAHLPCR